MKYVVTGASGLVGQSVVKTLMLMGCDVTAVGRSKSKLKTLFPTLNCLANEELNAGLASDVCLIHLAIVNNNGAMSQEEFNAGNIVFLKMVLESCAQNDVERFVYTSSTHVTRGKSDLYTESKRQAESVVNSYSGVLDIRLVRLAAIVGQGAKGKQKLLHQIPKIFRVPIMKIINVFLPVVSIERATEQIVRELVAIQKTK